MLFGVMTAMFVIRGLEDDGWFPENGNGSGADAKDHIEQVVYIVSVVSSA
jgi:predicted RNA binding protein YcfA (HicA-like mRNA interferase family)